MYLKFTIIFTFSIINFVNCLSKEQIAHYRSKTKEMFYHAYDAYLENAFEYDELKPITCEGVNTWGNFHLTLIDSLDSLIILKNYTQFNKIVRFIIQNVNFDYDLNVSVFESNIRIVGGLLSAHLLSYKTGIELDEGWPCEGPLLRLAEKMARKLLPAFDTETKMPYGTINLLYGVPFNETTITCASCVGSFILEFGTLSRLLGDDIFERTALEAIKSLHKSRSSLDLLGNHINVTDGQWTATDSSIGAAIDSYFEYLVKVYLKSIRKYMKKDDWHFMVNMNTGHITAPLFQSLESFYPGLLTLIGSLDEAKKIFLNNHHVWKEFGFLPEFYDVTGEIKRDGYPLRPEHVESIFYLYKATKDPQYLNYAIDILESIEFSAKTDCGYATIKDVRTHEIEDRQESFFLGETLKYLYLIFDEDNFIYNDGSKAIEIEFKNREGDMTSCLIDTSYVFNTEAHPFDSSILYCCSKEKAQDEEFIERLAMNVNYRNVIENSIMNNLINLKNTKKENESSISESSVSESLSDQILNDELEIDGLDCESELNRNFCLKLELKQSSNFYCSPTPFLFRFAKYGEVLKRDQN